MFAAQIDKPPLPEVGIPLGILIGVITGTTFLLLLKTVATARGDLKTLLEIAAEVLALPTFWFGGPFLTTNLLGSLQPDQIRNSYVGALACSFVLIAVWPLWRLILATADDISNNDD